MNSAIIEAISWALVHSIWQAAIVAMILATILPAFRRHRYLVSIASLTLMLVACETTFAQYHLGSPSQFAIQPPAANNTRDLAGHKTAGAVAAYFSGGPKTVNVQVTKPLPQVQIAQELNKEQEIVRDYVMLQLHKFVIGSGKIETTKINLAIDVVAIDGSQFPEVRTLLLETLEKSHADKNGNFPRKRILEVIGRMLAEDGQDRWSHEYSKRPGAAPQQRMILQGDSLYVKSPYLENVMKQGRKATRSDIDHYVMAIRNAHHPQTIKFLLDVLNEPTDSGSPWAAPAENPTEEPGIDFPSGDPTPTTPPANRKWADSSGASWDDAKLIAAIGLAELGRAEGVEWLIDKAQSNEAGNYKLRPMCNRALRNLTRGPSNKGIDDWAAWWQANKDRFTPNQVFELGTSINSQRFRSFQMPLPDPVSDKKPASFSDSFSDPE